MADRNRPLPNNPAPKAEGHPRDLPLRRGAAGGNPHHQGAGGNPQPEPPEANRRNQEQPDFADPPTSPLIMKAARQAERSRSVGVWVQKA
jgi:hypothetical protein